MLLSLAFAWLRSSIPVQCSSHVSDPSERPRAHSTYCHHVGQFGWMSGYPIVTLVQWIPESIRPSHFANRWVDHFDGINDYYFCRFCEKHFKVVMPEQFHYCYIAELLSLCTTIAATIVLLQLNYRDCSCCCCCYYSYCSSVTWSTAVPHGKHAKRFCKVLGVSQSGYKQEILTRARGFCNDNAESQIGGWRCPWLSFAESLSARGDGVCRICGDEFAISPVSSRQSQRRTPGLDSLTVKGGYVVGTTNLKLPLWARSFVQAGVKRGDSVALQVSWPEVRQLLQSPLCGAVG